MGIQWTILFTIMMLILPIMAAPPGAEQADVPSTEVTRDDLLELKDELGGSIIGAVTVNEKFTKLASLVSDVIDFAKSYDTPDESFARKFKELTDIEEEIKDSSGVARKFSVQIYKGAGGFRNDIDKILANPDGFDEEALNAKIREIKKFININHKALEDMERKYDGFDAKIRELKWQYQKAKWLGQNPTEDELQQLFQSDVLEFSKKELATVAKTLKTLTDDFLKKITKDENEATLSVDRTMTMSLNMEDLVESHNITKVQREYELFVKYKEHVRELYRSIIKDITDLKRKIQPFGNVKVFQMKLDELGDAVPEEWQKVCVGTFRAVLRILERYEERDFEWSQKLEELHVDSEVLKGHIGTITAHIETTREDGTDSQEKPAESPAGTSTGANTPPGDSTGTEESGTKPTRAKPEVGVEDLGEDIGADLGPAKDGAADQRENATTEESGDTTEESAKPDTEVTEPPSGDEATKEASEKTEGAATEEQDAKKDEEESKNLRIVFVKKHAPKEKPVPKEKDGAMLYGFNLVLILATFVMWA